MLIFDSNLHDSKVVNYTVLFYQISYEMILSPTPALQYILCIPTILSPSLFSANDYTLTSIFSVLHIKISTFLEFIIHITHSFNFMSIDDPCIPKPLVLKLNIEDLGKFIMLLSDLLGLAPLVAQLLNEAINLQF